MQLTCTHVKPGGTGKTSVAWGVASILKGVGIRFDGTKTDGVSINANEETDKEKGRKSNSRKFDRERNLTFLIVDKNHTVARFPFFFRKLKSPLCHDKSAYVYNKSVNRKDLIISRSN